MFKSAKLIFLFQNSRFFNLFFDSLPQKLYSTFGESGSYRDSQFTQYLKHKNSQTQKLNQKIWRFIIFFLPLHPKNQNHQVFMRK